MCAPHASPTSTFSTPGCDAGDHAESPRRTTISVFSKQKPEHPITVRIALPAYGVDHPTRRHASYVRPRLFGRVHRRSDEDDVLHEPEPRAVFPRRERARGVKDGPRRANIR